MAFDVTIRLPKSEETENTLGSIGVLRLRWDEADGAYKGRLTSHANTALGQQSHIIPHTAIEVAGDVPEYDWDQASPDTLRKFSRAAAVADGNAFFAGISEAPNQMETQYLQEARSAILVLEGLGIDPDAFAAMFPDPGSAFCRRTRYDSVPSPAAWAVETA